MMRPVTKTVSWFKPDPPRQDRSSAGYGHFIRWVRRTISRRSIACSHRAARLSRADPDDSIQTDLDRLTDDGNPHGQHPDENGTPPMTFGDDHAAADTQNH